MTELTFRDATTADLAFIVDLITRDAVAETPDLPTAPTTHAISRHCRPSTPTTTSAC